jgi:hypothetical protein
MTSRVPSPPPRRRYDRVGGTVLAVIGVAVAVVAVIALRHPNGRQARPVSLPTTATVTATPTPTPTPSSGAPSSTPGSTPSVATHSVPLVVLNNTSTVGLAKTARQRFEAAGWTVTSVGTMSNDILSTCAYYDPSDPANQQAAMELQQEFPAIKRVEAKFAELPAGPVVVVLTTDYS